MYALAQTPCTTCHIKVHGHDSHRMHAHAPACCVLEGIKASACARISAQPDEESIKHNSEARSAYSFLRTKGGIILKSNLSTKLMCAARFTRLWIKSRCLQLELPKPTIKSFSFLSIQSIKVRLLCVVLNNRVEIISDTRLASYTCHGYVHALESLFIYVGFNLQHDLEPELLHQIKKELASSWLVSSFTFHFVRSKSLWCLNASICSFLRFLKLLKEKTIWKIPNKHPFFLSGSQPKGEDCICIFTGAMQIFARNQVPL